MSAQSLCSNVDARLDSNNLCICVSVLQGYVGFTLSHILSSCHSWHYTRRSQRWEVTTAALRVLHAALSGPLMGQGTPNTLGQCQPDWSLAQAVAEAVSRPGGPAGYLFVNLPPHAGQSHAMCVQSWDCIKQEPMPLAVMVRNSCPSFSAHGHQSLLQDMVFLQIDSSMRIASK